MTGDCEALVVGGGIIGLATALSLARDFNRRVIVIEAETALAQHQTGRNSGVIHSGINYPPGSLKARYCIEGARLLYDFCNEHAIPHEPCGKLIIASDESQLPLLTQLHERARANGLHDVEQLNSSDVARFEPHARGVAALRVPRTGIVSFAHVAAAIARVIQSLGGLVHNQQAFIRSDRASDVVIAHTTSSPVRTAVVINCAGLYSDRVAIACGHSPDVRIVPFRGEYLALAPGARSLVRGLIYPVPDPRVPFLGVHLTRTIAGEVEAGPNAVMCFDRRGYRRGMFNVCDTLDCLRWPGWWKLGLRHWRTAAAEYKRSFFRAEFARSARQLVPDLRCDDFVAWRCGIRAQAVDRAGRLVDDFRIVDDDRFIHVLNAPSPAATASLMIGGHIARLADSRLRSRSV